MNNYHPRQERGEQALAKADIYHSLLLEIKAFIDQCVDEKINRILSEKLSGSLWTLKQVAKYLNVSIRTVENVIADGSIRPLWIRGVRRFDPGTIRAYLESNCR